MQRTRTVIAVAALAALALCVGPAQSAFPGTNGKIAFVGYDIGDNASHIYSINADGTEQWPLTNATANDRDPAWSPDGSKIAFARVEPLTEFSDVFVMNADGTSQTNLTNNPNSFISTDPAWSPGGNFIAFEGLALDGGTGFKDIYRMNADGTDRTNLTNTDDLDESRPAWSPDGSMIAFSGSNGSDRNLYVMSSDGSDDPAPVASLGEELAWSPDGDWIAFMSQMGGDAEIWAVRPDGSGLLNLTTNAADDFAPAWSPDGTRIVFHSTRGSGGLELYVMDANGGNQQPLVTATGGFSPDWQPLADSFGRITITKRIVPASDPGRFHLLIGDTEKLLEDAGDGGTRTKNDVAPGTYSISEEAAIPSPLERYDGRIACTKNGSPYLASGEPSALVDVAAGDHVTCTITNVRIYNTTPGTNVVVTPVDATTGDSPVTITFGQVTTAGDTTLITSSSGPPPPLNFEVAGAYYSLSTTAEFDQAEVCFRIVPPSAPTIGHWVGSPPSWSTPATYYRDAMGTTVPAGQATLPARW